MKPSIFYLYAQYIKAPRDRSGFTLLELVVVMAIFAVLLAVAVPNFESLVYGSTSNRALIELVGALQNARLKAIKTHQPVTVTFNAPAANQLRTDWNENGVARSSFHHLSRNAARVTFDNNPPGGAPAPDNVFTFTNLGFIQLAGGNPTANIYLIDNTNGRRFHIVATVGGGIAERQWDGAAWSGPVISHAAAGP